MLRTRGADSTTTAACSLFLSQKASAGRVDSAPKSSASHGRAGGAAAARGEDPQLQQSHLRAPNDDPGNGAFYSLHCECSGHDDATIKPRRRPSGPDEEAPSRCNCCHALFQVLGDWINHEATNKTTSAPSTAKQVNNVPNTSLTTRELADRLQRLQVR